jgi:hypothetical protein
MNKCSSMTFKTETIKESSLEIHAFIDIGQDIK